MKLIIISLLFCLFVAPSYGADYLNSCFPDIQPCNNGGCSQDQNMSQNQIGGTNSIIFNGGSDSGYHNYPYSTSFPNYPWHVIPPETMGRPDGNFMPLKWIITFKPEGLTMEDAKKLQKVK